LREVHLCASRANDPNEYRQLANRVHILTGEPCGVRALTAPTVLALAHTWMAVLLGVAMRSASECLGLNELIIVCVWCLHVASPLLHANHTARRTQA
jgi:hypothetical protein